MGAAAGKAVEDWPSSAGRTRAEDRLTVAEGVILESERRRSSRDATNFGIWDAQATCTNEGLLAAVDEIVFLKEMQAFPVASSASRRMDGALRAAMSCLMEELLTLKVWDGSQLEGRSGLRFAVDKLSVSVAAARGASSSFAFLTGGTTAGTVRTSTAELSFNTVDEMYGSGNHPAEHDVFLDGKFPDELDLICPASLLVLHEISLRAIRAGYTKELLHRFADAPCEVLDRFMSILQLGCSRETEADESISYENAEWWTAEDMIRRWILATKLVGKALEAMQKQLRAQSNGAFDRFKDDYLMAMAKRRSYTLLRFADGFTSTCSPEKLVYVLEMYEVLDSTVPGLLLAFTGQHKELFSRQVEVVLAKLARALRVMISGIVAKIRAGVSSGAKSETRGVGAGVHTLTRYTMACIESLEPHRHALDLILASTSGGGEGVMVSSSGDLFSELVASLEPNLEEISALRGAEGGGLRHLFMANNTSFVLKHAGALWGDDEWAACRRSRVEQQIAGYVEATWAPVVACLDAAGSGTKVLARFNAALEKAYNGHVRCEVPDPALRAALRQAVSEKVVAAYGAWLLKHPKLGRSAWYTTDGLAGLVSDLFEGEDAAGESYS